MTATTVSKSMEIQIVLAWNTFDRIPPAPAPMAKIRIIPKKYSALFREARSLFLRNLDKLSVPLLRLPIHIVLAYP